MKAHQARPLSQFGGTLVAADSVAWERAAASRIETTRAGTECQAAWMNKTKGAHGE